jgi:hypothetical protein
MNLPNEREIQEMRQQFAPEQDPLVASIGNLYYNNLALAPEFQQFNRDLMGASPAS